MSMAHPWSVDLVRGTAMPTGYVAKERDQYGQMYCTIRLNVAQDPHLFR